MAYQSPFHRTFSVILIIKDDYQAVAAALTSLSMLDYPKDHFEVIVVDDGSDVPVQESIAKEFSLALAYQPLFIYLPRCKQSSRARSRNRGVQQAKNDYLVFLDGDHIVEPSLLRNYNNYFDIKKPRNCVLGTRRLTSPSSRKSVISDIIDNGKMSPRAKINYSDDIRSRMLKKLEIMSIEMLSARWHLFWSCNFSIAKDLYNSVGGFDENFLGWGLEDSELGYRLQNENVPFELIDNYVWHISEPDINLNKKKYASWINNVSYFFKKYEDSRILLQFQFDDIYLNHSGIPNSLSHLELDWINAFYKFENKIRYFNSNESSFEHIGRNKKVMN